MGKAFKMVISPDGKEITTVYNDALDASQMGTLHINRATEVCYDNFIKCWRVIALKPLFAEEKVLATGFVSRKEALEYEISFLNEHMEELVAAKKCGRGWSPAQS